MKRINDIKFLLMTALLTLSMALFGTAAFADSHGAAEATEAMEETAAEATEAMEEAAEDATEATEEAVEETEEAVEEATEEATSQ